MEEGCREAEKKVIKQGSQDLSRSAEDSRMERVQGNEAFKLKEEMAKLKDKVQDLQEQTQVAEFRGEFNIVLAKNHKVAELMETIKRMQEQIDGLSNPAPALAPASASDWPQYWDGQWHQARPWYQA